MGRKGLNLEEKRTRLLEVYYEKVFIFKPYVNFLLERSLKS